MVDQLGRDRQDRPGMACRGLHGRQLASVGGDHGNVQVMEDDRIRPAGDRHIHGFLAEVTRVGHTGQPRLLQQLLW